MQRCTHCSAQQLDGTIFCTECGASLISNRHNRETTTDLNRVAADGLANVTELEPRVIDAPLQIGAPMLSLVVLNSGRRIRLDGTQPLLVGRKDNQRNNFPDVDLGLDGGHDAGVSRRHALIAPQGPGFTLKDLDSANGTFINGRRIQPNAIAAIKTGDELKFGTLILRFEIE
ncbi:MAG: FHA domain-containing protein [Oscillochloridaceae bacterium umkhey_bin13]